jgi:hypothetical protein
VNAIDRVLAPSAAYDANRGADAFRVIRHARNGGVRVAMLHAVGCRGLEGNVVYI